MQHVNFYENVKEADIRLKDTVVLYDGNPYYVLCISDHKKDGIFRIYLDDLSRVDGPAHHRLAGIPKEYYDEPNKTKGDMMDEFIERNEGCGIIRKMMNSPSFNKYRPFPLGMVNHAGTVMYSERTPTRYTQQGLISSMVVFTEPDVTGGGGPQIIRKSQIPNILSYQFSQMLRGDYPRPDECIANLNDSGVANRGIGFHRNFAFVRGPIGLLFLAYKQDIVGYMPHGDLSRVTLAHKFRHTKEVVDDLKLFDDIKVVSA